MNSRADSARRKVFQVAQELKVITPTILEFLESQGYDISRKQMQPVSEEMYVELLRRFDRNRFQKYQTEKATEEEDSKRSDSIRLREEELKKILDAKKPTAPSEAKRIELPRYRRFVVEPAAAVERATESAVGAAEKPAGKPGRRKRAVPSAEAEKKPVLAPEAAQPERAAAEAVGAAKPAAKRKIELPKLKALRILEKATQKPTLKRKLRRKRVVVAAETPSEAIEAEVESRLRKVEVKESRQKTAPKKAEPAPVAQQMKRRRRKRKRVRAGVKDKQPLQAAGRGRKRRKIDEHEVAATIKQTIARMAERSHHRRRHVREQEPGVEVAEGERIKVTEFITTQELANMLEVPVQEVIKHCLEMGMIISINQRLDRDLIELLSAEFSAEVEIIQEEELEQAEEIASSDNPVKRPPVVTVMGHVDHGKTKLLDYLRRTRVAEAEYGGITQHIGAYEVVYKDERITFLDTPGHEAFTAMRARGAQATDIVVLVIAADDRVMPQTLEGIDHAKAAGVPIVIAVNKIDKPSANPESIYKQLADNNILVEKWGGKYQSAEISAKFGQGIDDLLAEILVAADILDLKADPTVRARGVVVESRLDKGLGAVATILIQGGTLRIGDPFVVGWLSGRVRALYNEFNEKRNEAGPSTPIQVVGFDGVPQAGDRLTALSSEKEAREVSLRRQRQQRELSQRKIHGITLEHVSHRMQEKELKNLPLLIKGDVHGSVEVLADSLMKLSNNEVMVDIIHRGVGGIVESDVLLAAASKAVVIGFHVHPNPQAREVARREGVEVRLYRIIHEVVDDVRRSLEGLLAPEHEERHIGRLEVRRVFKTSRIGNIAGCYVADGKITRQSKLRLLRDDVELWSGEPGSLKRFQDDVREVSEGSECGLTLGGYNDIREGDIIESFEVVELTRKLESAVWT